MSRFLHDHIQTYRFGHRVNIKKKQQQHLNNNDNEQWAVMSFVTQITWRKRLDAFRLSLSAS